jgi:NAD(P)-dependent dehydrogenase (short-subunit alcohol dehydrogenase family)
MYGTAEDVSRKRKFFMSEKRNANAHSIVGKAAIVTGGTRGIGRAIALRLLEEGSRVAICGTKQSTVDHATAELSIYGEVLGIVADVSKLDDVRRLVAAANERFGGIDILVNNAGSATMRAVGDLEPDEFDRMIAVNLAGVYYSCHEVMPIFKQRGGGDIVNISSLAGKNPFAGGAGYNASKFGLNGFSEAMMLDHRADGVRVSYVMPGSVATEFGGHPLGADGKAAGAEWKIAPEDIADVVEMLLIMPRRTTVSRVEIRPSRPPGR